MKPKRRRYYKNRNALFAGCAPCEVCKGKRYNRETLEVKYKDKSIYDVLNMTVEEALTFFENIPSIRRKIETR